MKTGSDLSESYLNKSRGMVYNPYFRRNTGNRRRVCIMGRSCRSNNFRRNNKVLVLAEVQ